MDLQASGGVSAAASDLSTRQTGDSVGVMVMKKALDQQATSAAQLISAIPQPARLPQHLGQNVNTVA